MISNQITYQIPAFTPPWGTVTTVTPWVAAVAEVQEIAVDATGGTFTITYDGQTTSALAFDVSAADMETALDALSNITDGDVEVTGGPWDAGGTTPYVLTWLSSLGATVATPTTDPALLTGGAGTADVSVTTPWVTAVSEVQTIEITGTGGTFTITWSGQTTSALAYNASAATVQAALWALSNISDNDVTVTLTDQTYTLTWLSSLGNVAAPTVTTTGLSVVVGRWLSAGFASSNVTLFPDTSPWYTLKFVKSNYDVAVEPEFGSDLSSTNQWEYVEVVDTESGTDINGTTGVAISATTTRTFEYNIAGALWVGIVVSAYTAGNLTGNVLLTNAV